MEKIGNWIVSADIGGLTYAWKVFDCTAQQAVAFVRRKYAYADNIKVESALGKFDRALA